jgi:hypothetical protein
LPIISCLMMKWYRAICRRPNKAPCFLGYFKSSPPFFTPSDAQALKASDPRARVLTLQVKRPSSPIGP